MINLIKPFLSAVFLITTLSASAETCVDIKNFYFGTVSQIEGVLESMKIRCEATHCNESYTTNLEVALRTLKSNNQTANTIKSILEPLYYNPGGSDPQSFDESMARLKNQKGALQHRVTKWKDKKAHYSKDNESCKIKYGCTLGQPNSACAP